MPDNKNYTDILTDILANKKREQQAQVDAANRAKQERDEKFLKDISPLLQVIEELRKGKFGRFLHAPSPPSEDGSGCLQVRILIAGVSVQNALYIEKTGILGLIQVRALSGLSSARVPADNVVELVPFILSTVADSINQHVSPKDVNV